MRPKLCFLERAGLWVRNRELVRGTENRIRVLFCATHGHFLLQNSLSRAVDLVRCPFEGRQSKTLLPA